MLVTFSATSSSAFRKNGSICLERFSWNGCFYHGQPRNVPEVTAAVVKLLAREKEHSSSTRATLFVVVKVHAINPSIPGDLRSV